MRLLVKIKSPRNLLRGNRKRDIGIHSSSAFTLVGIHSVVIHSESAISPHTKVNEYQRLKFTQKWLFKIFIEHYAVNQWNQSMESFKTLAKYAFDHAGHISFYLTPCCFNSQMSGDWD